LNDIWLRENLAQKKIWSEKIDSLVETLTQGDSNSRRGRVVPPSTLPIGWP